jgi:hypothetical protein
VIVPPCRQLRRAALDVAVTDAEILDVPVELRLELMAVIRSNLADTEREFSDNMIHKVYGIGLGVLFLDL